MICYLQAHFHPFKKTSEVFRNFRNLSLRYWSISRISFVALIVFLSIPVSVSAQDGLKQEREERIKPDEMPQTAKKYLEGWLDKSRRIRYYYETDGEHTSYEAKLIREDRRFSIEFDETGNIEDIEELIRFKQMPDSVQQTVDSFLTKRYGKYTIRRVQQQFLVNQDEQYDQLITQRIENFEIEVDLTEKSGIQSYEMLFDTNGKLKQQRLIVRRSLDNFLY